MIDKGSTSSSQICCGHGFAMVVYSCPLCSYIMEKASKYFVWKCVVLIVLSNIHWSGNNKFVDHGSKPSSFYKIGFQLERDLRGTRCQILELAISMQKFSTRTFPTGEWFVGMVEVCSGHTGWSGTVIQLMKPVGESITWGRSVPSQT